MLNILAFLRVALPWVLTGVPLAILAANLGAKKEDSVRSSRIATGAALGLMLGAALDSTGLWDSHALGLAIGPLWGMALAAIRNDKHAENGAD